MGGQALKLNPGENTSQDTAAPTNAALGAGCLRLPVLPAGPLEEPGPRTGGAAAALMSGAAAVAAETE